MAKTKAPEVEANDAGGSKMVAFYVNRIKKGKVFLDDVPERWRAAVEEALAKEGLA